jgi:hypothetical protein
MRAILRTAAISLALMATANQLYAQTTLAQGSATQPADGATAVPVRHVVLYSSGVGYFEHFGNVKGSASTELRFKTAQINDILKSLVLEDLDKGKISVVTYPSQDPLSKTLKSFQVDISANPSLADLLNQLRGAKVSIAAQGEKLEATISASKSDTRKSETKTSSKLRSSICLPGAIFGRSTWRQSPAFSWKTHGCRKS